MPEAAKCSKCGSKMIALNNKNKGAYATCPTPEKHTGIPAKKAGKKTAAVQPDVTPEPAKPPVPKPVDQPKKKSFLSGLF